MSLRLTLLNALLRLTVKRRLGRMTDPAAARQEFALFARLFLPGQRRAPLRTDPATGLPVAGGPAAGGGPVLLWFHGGGYIAGSSQTHRGLAGRLSLAAGLPVFLPDYRLGPEHPVPAAQDDARAAWESLRAAGHAPGRIALGGDSAGGGLALSLLAALLAEGVRPGPVVLMSPWTDLTGAGASLAGNAAADPMLPAERFGDLVGFAIGLHPPDDPLVSPLFARFPDCPDVLIQYSGTEILRDDALRMADRLRAEGADVVLAGWPAPPHAWPIFGGWLPESRAAVAGAAAFLRDRLSRPRAR